MRKKFELPDELKFLTIGRLPQKTTRESLSGKICVITGTTSGVGYEAALRIARAGAKIVMIVRNRQKAEYLCETLRSLSGEEPDYYIADFTDLAQVRNAAEAIRNQYPRIDILINNAGVHMTRRRLTPEGHETAFCVNHLASFLITGILLRTMVKSAPSRIIQVNSEGHRFNGLRIDDLDWAKRGYYRGLQGYGAAKTAQLMTVWELNDLLRGKGVTINAVHPGAVKSNIGHNNGILYNLYSKYLIQPLLKKPAISGEALYYLAASPEMANISGKFFNLTNEEPPAPHAMNRELGKQIFQRSIELTQLEEERLYEL
ncbi:MAG TPA: SDR family NAD(P)-dependent oxidoreductase [Prolixibacteraceae bacterium]|nr:SDR family NAD(P)-dependent oxidoreductase [Prolixibacteraceae bacterium]